MRRTTDPRSIALLAAALVGNGVLSGGLVWAEDAIPVRELPPIPPRVLPLADPGQSLPALPPRSPVVDPAVRPTFWEPIADAPGSTLPPRPAPATVESLLNQLSRDGTSQPAPVEPRAMTPAPSTGANGATGATGRPLEPPRTPGTPGTGMTGQPLRDPTVPTDPELERMLRTPQDERAPAAAALPTIGLRGRIIPSGTATQALAILEVNGQRYMVHPGAKLQIQGMILEVGKIEVYGVEVTLPDRQQSFWVN